MLGIDLDAVRAAPGVVAVLTAADIPGKNDVEPGASATIRCSSTGAIEFHGQVAVRRRGEDPRRRRAAPRKLAKVEVAAGTPLRHRSTTRSPPTRTILPDYTFRKDDSAAALAAAPHRVKGRLRIGGQEHFYLEGQVALAIPGEDGDMLVHSSTQHPSEVQHLVAHVLGVPDDAVTVEVRRMGGGFGGKETPGRRNGRRSPRSARARPAGRARSGSTATTT